MNINFAFPGKGKSFPHESVQFTNGILFPHWELPDSIYHICLRLNDSVPMSLADKWRKEIDTSNGLLNNGQQTIETIVRNRFLQSEHIEQLLHSGYGKCELILPGVPEIVKATLELKDTQDYILFSWCLMPNHLHIIVLFLEPMRKVVGIWKSVSTNLINKHLKRTGILWQMDFYNHIIRTKKEFDYQMNYVWKNPEKIGHSNWQWRWINSEFIENNN